MKDLGGRSRVAVGGVIVGGDLALEEGHLVADAEARAEEVVLQEEGEEDRGENERRIEDNIDCYEGTLKKGSRELGG